MSQNSRGMTPLNWQDLVAETLRRRKEERLTQREHAALANVSIPTMAAFERAETTLTLAKAFDILRVVGLVDEPKPGDAHDRFVRDAFARWKSLAETLPADSPGRFPHGWFRFDYQLVGDLKKVNLEDFESAINRATIRHTGWPLFTVVKNSEFEPKIVDSDLECWLHSPNLWGPDPSHSDFWKASPSGSLFLIRGYKEDGQETFSPATIFDTTLPIWRMAEALLHAEKLASILAASDTAKITVRFRATYSSLLGRVLRSWANPTAPDINNSRAARADEAILHAEMTTQGISEYLVDRVLPLVSSLYERFGIEHIERSYIENELRQMRASTFR
jgi:transcriptional regulator with XRE-family HTH domain